MDTHRTLLENLKQKSRTYWEAQEQVSRFATIQTDERLKEWVQKHPDCARLAILDLGCASGRNTEWLFFKKTDVYAVDRSLAMVTATRQRVQHFADSKEQRKRILQGDICDLNMFESKTFDLVLAIGILQSAVPFEQWKRALKEIYRVLKSGGEMLLSNFSPQSKPYGESLQPLPGFPHCYSGFGPGALCLLEAAEMDEAISNEGFEVCLPSECVRVAVDEGYRISIKGHFRKPHGSKA